MQREQARLLAERRLRRYAGVVQVQVPQRFRRRVARSAEPTGTRVQAAAGGRMSFGSARLLEARRLYRPTGRLHLPVQRRFLGRVAESHHSTGSSVRRQADTAAPRVPRRFGIVVQGRSQRSMPTCGRRAQVRLSHQLRARSDQQGVHSRQRMPVPAVERLRSERRMRRPAGRL